MEILQHVIDKFTSDCGVGFGVLFLGWVASGLAIKIILGMWATDRKNLLDTIIKMQENLVHASENMDKIVMAIATSQRSHAPGED